MATNDDNHVETRKYPRPQLGEWRTITAKANRRRKWDDIKRQMRKYWERQQFDTSVTAVFIGWRTCADGTRDWEDDEVGYVFYLEQSFELWMFVDNVRHKPFYVFPEDVQ